MNVAVGTTTRDRNEHFHSQRRRQTFYLTLGGHRNSHRWRVVSAHVRYFPRWQKFLGRVAAVAP